MLYLGIDQHAKQLTVCVRNAAGDTVFRRQVSTRREKVRAFFEQLTAMDSQFMAILEVCGFNDWLIAELHQWNCQEVVLIHPEKPSKKKTDRRDAKKLSDLLWLNRGRLAAGEPVHGLRSRLHSVTARTRESAAHRLASDTWSAPDSNDQQDPPYLESSQSDVGLSDQELSNRDQAAVGSKKSSSPRSIAWKWTCCW